MTASHASARAGRTAEVGVCRWLPSGHAYLAVTTSTGRMQAVLMRPGPGRDPRQWQGRLQGLGSDNVSVLCEPWSDRLHVGGMSLLLDLRRLRNLIEHDQPTNLEAVTTTTPPSPATSGGQEAPMPTPTAQPTVDAQRPPLDQPLTIAQIGEAYGITAGPVHREHSAGRLAKVGTDGKRHYTFSHRDLLDAVEEGRIGMPRAGGRNDRPRDVIDAAKRRLRESLHERRDERAAEEECEKLRRGELRTYDREQVAAILGVKPDSVRHLAVRDGQFKRVQRRPALYDADSVDAHARAQGIEVPAATAPPAPEPEAVAPAATPAQAGPTPPLVAEAKASTHGRIAVAELQLRAGAELAVLRGMVAMLPVEQREVLSPQLARVQAALVTDDEG